MKAKIDIILYIGAGMPAALTQYPSRSIKF